MGRVAATDADYGRNAELTFEFTSPSQYFDLDPTTGLITTLLTLDREQLLREVDLEFISTLDETKKKNDKKYWSGVFSDIDG